MDEETRQRRQREFTIYLVLFILLVIVGKITTSGQLVDSASYYRYSYANPYGSGMYPAGGFGDPYFNPHMNAYSYGNFGPPAPYGWSNGPFGNGPPVGYQDPYFYQGGFNRPNYGYSYPQHSYPVQTHYGWDYGGYPNWNGYYQEGYGRSPYFDGNGWGNSHPGYYVGSPYVNSPYYQPPMNPYAMNYPVQPYNYGWEHPYPYNGQSNFYQMNGWMPQHPFYQNQYEYGHAWW